jgi:uncharacterized surface protein with fasciclin (FAS1) repeats
MKLFARFTLFVAVLALAFASFSPALAAREKTTIVEKALEINAATGEFSTLIAAVVAADLVDTLNGNRQFTVFAPTDAAFAKLGLNAGNIGTAFDKATLTKILLYHVAPGERFAADVVESDKIRMMTKSFADVEVNDMGAYIDGAKIIATDVNVDNGVIHVIDSVMLP